MNKPTTKIELVIRRNHKNVMIAAVMLSENFKVGDIAAMEMFGKVTNGKIHLFISKAMYSPKNEYGETFESVDLSDLATEEIWRKCKSDQPLFGGVIIGRDMDMLFSFEESDQISRTALISVVQDDNDIIDVDEHAVYRSSVGTEYSNGFEFTLEKDESKETAVLLKELRGDTISSFYRKPFFTLFDGTKYRLSSLADNKTNLLYLRKNEDIIKHGKPTEETLKMLGDYGLNCSLEHDFFDYIREIYKAEPIFLDKFSRLLTEEEHERISNASLAIINTAMNLKK
ncbi:hypothetical protein [Photobacterium kishitanii]|uniref:Uncharacterized protein n=1 Tax=Photobacterium kishitanii TaxID=318456 RepID=A0A2T3KLA6_9GAMM|nr:hypothetical protein [Photobacterium kishitanii]PSV00439.1 hypothetical protein C9J27_04725 [Photobacterium kishitanii]